MSLVTLQTAEGARVRLEQLYTECRDRTLGGGHVWERNRKLGRRTDMGVPFSKQCARCGAWVHLVIGAWGQVVSRSYEYPDGYSLAADEQPTGDSLRLAVLGMIREEQRELNFDDEGIVKQTRRTRKPAAKKTSSNGRAKRKPAAKKKTVDLAGAERNEARPRRGHLVAV